jgi:hypothetical protein
MEIVAYVEAHGVEEDQIKGNKMHEGVELGIDIIFLKTLL